MSGEVAMTEGYGRYARLCLRLFAAGAVLATQGLSPVASQAQQLVEPNLTPVLLTYNGNATLPAFDEPFYIDRQIRFATQSRFTDRGSFSVGAIHLYSIDRATWDTLRLPAGGRCETQAVKRGKAAVTHVYFWQSDGSPVRGGLAQACFLRGIYGHYGVEGLPEIDRLVRDKDFMTIQGRWFTRLYQSSQARGAGK